MQDTSRRIGYVGLGIMGSAMAANLRKAGFELIVWNRTPARCEPLVKLGAKQAASPADVVRQGAEIVCVNVTATADVEAVLFGPEGIAAAARAGLIVMDHSTISPTATQEFARRLAVQGVTLLDAPVSGGDVGAKAGTLAIMVGGPLEGFDAAMPVLRAMGKTITHVGASGMGQACKACNQVAVAGALMGVAEAIALARGLGLDGAKMLEVVGAGAGASWQLANLGPKILAGDYRPGFMVDLMRKDLGIVGEASGGAGLELEGTAAATRYFAYAARNLEAGRQGTQALFKAVVAKKPV